MADWPSGVSAAYMSGESMATHVLISCATNVFSRVSQPAVPSELSDNTLHSDVMIHTVLGPLVPQMLDVLIVVCTVFMAFMMVLWFYKV